MSPRTVAADLTGRCTALAARLGLSTRASRQADRHRARPPRDVSGPVEAPGAPGLPIRLLVLGNGPVESPGLDAGQGTFASRIADAVAERTGRTVRVTTVIGAGFDLPVLGERLREEQLHWHDALVVSAAYRPELADVPLARWRDYTAGLKAVLVEAAGPDTAIRVLSLPWRSAARDAPADWGGAFGLRVVALAEAAESTLEGDPHALPLRLADPVDAAEWAGPAFSPETYRRWADQVADDLVPALRSAPS